MNIPDIEIMTFRVSQKKWNWSSSSFEGPEIEELPELLKDKKSIDYDVSSKETTDAVLKLMKLK